MDKIRIRRLVAAAAVVGAVGAGVVLVDSLPVGASAGQTVTNLNDGLTPTALAQSLAGDGVTVSNVQYQGSNLAAGKFSGFNSAVGIDSGVVLSSGAVKTSSDETGDYTSSITGPNDNDGTSGGFDLPGDSDLDAVVSPDSTHDASVLQFDVTPKGNRLAFDYVFGSEEYNEYVNEFNDVFGFYVNGVNCAKVGAAGQPVSIDTINKEKNANLYRNNDPSDGTPQIDTQLDGLTKVLTCEAAVTPNVVNHLKLAIADTNDTALDSSVLIRARSLEAANPPVSNADSYSAVSGSPLTIAAPGVLSNDTDPQGRSLSVSTADVTQPAHGTVSVNSDGSFTYTAATGFAGSDSFTYKASNGVAASNAAATVTITVGSGQSGQTPSVDKVALGYRAYASSEVVTNSAAASKDGELFVAYVQADGPAGTKQSVRSVTGGGLTWTRTAYADLSGAGANEAWQAFSPTAKPAFRVSASFTLPADGALTVVSYQGAAQSLGSVHITSTPSGPAANTIVPTRSNSLIAASGLNWSTATKPVAGTGQTLTTYALDKTVDDAYWTQAVTAPTTAGTPVTVRAGVPSGDRWSLVAVEIKPAA